MNMINELPAGKILRPLNLIETVMTNAHVYANGTSQIVLLLDIYGQLDVVRLQHVYEDLCLHEPILSSVILAHEGQWVVFQPQPPVKPLFIQRNSLPQLPTNDISRFDQLMADEADNSLDINKHLIRLTVLGQDKHYWVILTIAHGIGDGFTAKRLLSYLLCTANQNTPTILQTANKQHNATDMAATVTSQDYAFTPSKRIHDQINAAIQRLPVAQQQLQTGLRTVEIAATIITKLALQAKQLHLTVNALLTSIICQAMMDVFGLKTMNPITAISYRTLLQPNQEIEVVGCLVGGGTSMIHGHDIIENARQIYQDIVDTKKQVISGQPTKKPIDNTSIENIMIVSRDQVLAYCNEVIFTNTGCMDKIRLPTNLALQTFRIAAALSSSRTLTSFHISFIRGQLIFTISYSAAILSAPIMDKLVQAIQYHVLNFIEKS